MTRLYGPYCFITHKFSDSSGARVHELSAPLAAAGISILYQSSYLSDFIFVRPKLYYQIPRHSKF